MVSRTLQASDPRDKVFGLLGLTASDSDPDSSTFIEPDYSLSMAGVYTAVARKAIVEQKDFNVLATVQHGDHVHDDLISWVPDWRTPSTDYLYSSTRRTSQCTIPAVSTPVCPGCGHLGLGDTISVRGITVGIIEDLAVENFNTSNWLHPDLPKRLQAAVQRYKDRYDVTTLAFTLSGGFTLAGNLIEDASAHVAEYKAFKKWGVERCLAGAASITAPSATEGEDVASAYQFYANCGPTVFGRRLFVTDNGMLGLGPLAMREDNEVVVLFGGNVPFVLRPHGNGQHYRLVGECYMHGVMEGRAVRDWRKNPPTDFHIF